MRDPKPRKGETRKQYLQRAEKERQAELSALYREFSEGRRKVCLELDDFGFLLPGHDELLTVRRSFPNLKVTCFTVPFPKEFFHYDNYRHFSFDKYRRWAELVNSLDWLEIAVHGFAHTHHECDVGYGQAKTMIRAVENMFARVGLKYERIWRAPYWQESYDMLTALSDEGWTISLDRNAPKSPPEGAQTYTYTHSLEEPFLPNGNVIFSHGHAWGPSPNTLLPNLLNMCRLWPHDTQFLTLSEALKTQSHDKKKTA